MRLLVVFLLFVVVGLVVQNVDAKKRKKHFLIPAPSPIVHCNSLPSIAVYFSLDAYRDLGRGENPVYSTCGGKFKLLSSTDNIGYTGKFRSRIFYSEKDSLVIFTVQGTNPTSWSDWMNDFSIKLAPCNQDYEGKKGIAGTCSGGRFHDGFLKEWAYVRASVLNDLKAIVIEKNPAKLLVTGHSKGAGMAYIAAADIKSQLAGWKVNPKLYNINFGCPRPGDSTFSDYYESLRIPTKRYSISTDPVTMVPLGIMGFSHVGGDSTAIPLRCPLSNLIFFCHEGYQGVVDVGSTPQGPLVTDRKRKRFFKK